MTNITAVEYRYYLTDLLSNTLISEVPFKNVSYESVNRRAGSFSGSIPYIPATAGLDLYSATMPGRTGIYVMRNGVCVWGGILWSRSYNVLEKTLQVDGSEFISYLYHRNVWKTLIYGSEYIGIFKYSISSGVANIQTEVPHNFSVGDKVKISTTSPVVDGNHTITSKPSSTRFTFTTSNANLAEKTSTSGACRSLVDTYDLARDLIDQISFDIGGVQFSNEYIKPAIEYQKSVISAERSSNLVTLRTLDPHEIIPGQEIEVLEVGLGLDGTYIATTIPDANTINYELLGADVARTSLGGIRSVNILTKSVVGSVAVMTTDAPHGGSVGTTVILENVDPFTSGQLDSTFNGRFKISNVISATSFAYFCGGILDVPVTAVSGGKATFGSKILYRAYGSYTYNSDVGIGFETPIEKSGAYQVTQTFRGFEQKTAGELLETYSNTTNGGFEYRIDCDYDYETASFTRTFKIIPDGRQTPKAGDLYTAVELGADLTVFEYPGNITNFTIEESAEESATRFFVVGSIEDISDEASQPYAGAAATDLLNNPNGRSWPLLDQVEVLSDQVSSSGDKEDENSLYNFAKDYLDESRPPIGTFSVSVNGSLNPVVGSYNPGDWCTIIVDDQFVRERLANDQEPRSDYLLRKISSYKVSVPDSPTFPEQVELELITDWGVDKLGN